MQVTIDKPVFDKSITCCFSGHRKLGLDFERQNLKNEIIKKIECGYINFLVGMALGFDTECVIQLVMLKQTYPNVKIIACIPCLQQSRFYNEYEKNLYEKILNESDQKIVFFEKYNPWCMHSRNRYMVDNSSALICYLRQNEGGTKSTVEYATKSELEIIKL